MSENADESERSVAKVSKEMILTKHAYGQHFAVTVYVNYALVKISL